MVTLEQLEKDVADLIVRMATPENWQIDITREEEPDECIFSDFEIIFNRLTKIAWSPTVQPKIRELRDQLMAEAWKAGISIGK
jgi:hypothetical protein